MEIFDNNKREEIKEDFVLNDNVFHFTLKVDVDNESFFSSGIAKNLGDAQQYAAQDMITKILPGINSWLLLVKKFKQSKERSSDQMGIDLSDCDASE